MENAMLPIILTIRDDDDRHYVERIYRKFGKKLYWIAYEHTHNHEDSEDCVGDVMVVLINNLEKFTAWPSRHQINFLIKCCRCIAIDKYHGNEKRRKNEISLEDERISPSELADSAQDVEKLAVSEENRKKIVRYIEEMDPIYSDILYLRVFAGMKNGQIAQMLNISQNLVAVRFLRAKKIIAERIANDE